MVEAEADSRISSSSLLQEQQPLAGAAAAVAIEVASSTAAATSAVRQKAKVAAVERRASARALTLATLLICAWSLSNIKIHLGQTKLSLRNMYLILTLP